MPLASGAVLQMDQTASENQILFRHFRKCGEDSNLDRCLGLRACCHSQKAAQSVRQSVRNPTDLELDVVRENPYGSITYQNSRRRNSADIRKSAVFV